MYMFKKISFTKLIINLETTVRRFPMIALVSACTTTLSIVLLHVPNDESHIWAKILMILALSFPLFICSTFIYETKLWKKKYKYLLDLLILAALIAYYLALPKDITSNNVEAKILVTYILILLSAILCITFTSFIFKKSNLINAFWQYNKNLVFSLILTGIYTSFLGTGLAIALGSVGYLFELDISGDRYAEIWIILWTLFAPLFFLSRIPKDLLELEKDTNYPKELRLFVQFVLLPLVSLYFVILYVYTLKVVISWEWPKGVLAYMISGFSFLGVLVYMALYPLRDTYIWAKKFGYIFFIVIIPQVAMLFWALWFRISKYSITENRALVFIFGCWLLGMALYFLINKRKDIRLIPATLCIIMILSVFGPWSIFNISKNSQTNRLFNILQKYDAVLEDKIVVISDSESVPDEDKKEISGTVSYLYNIHGHEYVQSIVSDSIRKQKDNSDEMVYMSAKEIVEDIVGIDYMVNLKYDNESEHFNITADDVNQYNLSGFDYLIVINRSAGKESSGSDYGYDVKQGIAEFEITKGSEIIVSYNLDALIDDMIEENGKNSIYDVDPNEMVIRGENDKIMYELYLDYVGGRIFNKSQDGNKYENLVISGILLFSKK